MATGMEGAAPTGRLAAIDAAAKRGLDLVLAGAALLVLWPLLLALAVWVRLDSPGPVFYRARRVGQDGQPFTMLKYRTMRAGADGGSGITGAADQRITRLGRRLRASRLDELPQLINVLRGEMSLVGPRPEAPEYVRLYTPEQLRVLSVRPGITGLTQIRFRDEATMLTEADVEAQYIREILPAKLASDLEYVRTRTLRRDVAIVLETARLALGRPSRGPES